MYTEFCVCVCADVPWAAKKDLHQNDRTEKSLRMKTNTEKSELIYCIILFVRVRSVFHFTFAGFNCVAVWCPFILLLAAFVGRL